MSRNINVNPGHYKVRGRERQGEDVIQSVEKQTFAQERAEAERWRAQKHDQMPGWENPAQPLADEPPPQRPAAARRTSAKTRTRRQASSSSSRQRAKATSATKRKTTRKPPARKSSARKTSPKRAPRRK